MVPGSHQRDSSTDYYDPIARHARHDVTSDATRSFSGVTSPHAHEQYSPASASPVAASAVHHERSHLHPLHGHDLRDRHSSATSTSPAYLAAATSPPPPFSVYDPKHETRNPRRDPPGLQRADSSVPSVPSLAHTDTSLSSISGATSRHGSSTSIPPLRPFVAVDGPKAHRILPQPIPSSVLATSIPDSLAPTGLPTRLASPAPLAGDRRGGLDALLIATEMVGKTGRDPVPPEDHPP